MRLRDIQASDSLEGIVRMGAVFLKRVVNGPTTPELRRRIEQMAAELRGTIGDRPISELEPVRQTRKLYHSLGCDPTKDRPASERLLRRIVRGEGLPELCQVVDALNLVSLVSQRPLGFYDWDKLSPPILARIGRPDERYSTRGERLVHAGGRVVLVDGEGLFGNPSQDAERVAIEFGTVRALVVAWLPADASNDDVDQTLDEISTTAQEYCQAVVGERGVIT